DFRWSIRGSVRTRSRTSAARVTAGRRWAAGSSTCSRAFHDRRLRREEARTDKGDPMRIELTSIYVDEQDKALRFYSEVLGFVKKADVSEGGYRWLTVASREAPD